MGQYETRLQELLSMPRWEVGETAAFKAAFNNGCAAFKDVNTTLEAYGHGQGVDQAAVSAIDTSNRTGLNVDDFKCLELSVTTANDTMDAARGTAQLPSGKLDSGWEATLRTAEVGAEIAVPGYGILKKVTGIDPIGAVNDWLGRGREAEAKKQVEALENALGDAQRLVEQPREIPPSQAVNIDPIPIPIPDPRHIGGGGGNGPGGGGGGGRISVPGPGGIGDPGNIGDIPDYDGHIGDLERPGVYDPGIDGHGGDNWGGPYRYTPMPGLDDRTYPGGPGGDGDGSGNGHGRDTSVDSNMGGTLGMGAIGAGTAGLGFGAAGKLGQALRGGAGGFSIPSYSVTPTVTNPNGTVLTPASLAQGGAGGSAGRGMLAAQSGNRGGMGMMGGGGGGAGGDKKDKARRAGLGLMAPKLDDDDLTVRSRGTMAGGRRKK